MATTIMTGATTAISTTICPFSSEKTLAALMRHPPTMTSRW